ncbi:hypothetical protein [Streptomyces showdoensis]|uniref:hypothetical protein n=1 Tax=Streptomyces showdoensis TaxID=68268 RepID=UPI0013F4D6A7|nr:hypothetical protein [Streptomyces showdoensis]
MSAPTVEVPVVPQRRRIAVGKKTGRGPLVVEMSDADKAAHVAASYVRPKR